MTYELVTGLIKALYKRSLQSIPTDLCTGIIRELVIFSSIPTHSPKYRRDKADDIIPIDTARDLHYNKINDKPFRKFVVQPKPPCNNPLGVPQAVKPIQDDRIASSDIKISPQPEKPVTNEKIVDESSSSAVAATQNSTVPLYHWGDHFHRVPFWQKIPRWQKWTEKEFLDHKTLVSPGLSLYYI